MHIDQTPELRTGNIAKFSSMSDALFQPPLNSPGTPAQTPELRRSPRNHTASSVNIRRKRNSDDVSDDKSIANNCDDEFEDFQSRKSKSKAFKKPSKRTRTEILTASDISVESSVKGIPDRLLANLDIVFCGINPSLTSERNKLHFSGPGNQFYNCLRRAAFVTPEITYEDAPNLPQLFSIGLTDLVARATASVDTHLCLAKMTKSVPAFLEKIIECCPRIVCFMSLGIGELVSRAVLSPWKPPLAPRKAGEGKKKRSTGKILPAKTARARQRPTTSLEPEVEPDKSAKLADIQEYLLPFKLRYPEGNVAETLFFALPSTSAANACSYYVQDKMTLFTKLYVQLQLIKQSTNALNTANLKIVDLAKLKI